MPTVQARKQKRIKPAAAKKRSARVSSRSSAAPRRDPSARAPDISVGLEAIWNTDSSRFYCWVQKNNAGTYEAMGYEAETHREDGPKCRADRYSEAKDGKEIELYGDCILMSIDKADRKQIEEYGINGRGGAKRVDALEKRIVANRSGIYGNEPSRGLNNRYFGVVNSTGPAEEISSREFVGSGE